MDEEAAKRLVARERQTFQSDLMDEETVKRKLAAERAQQNEKSKKEEDEEERQRANAARAVTLTNLKQAASLNGSRGVLERFDATSGRWEVKLSATGDVKAIPRSPPPATVLTGRAGARSSGAPPPPAKPVRRTGIIRWYNGRRRLGAVIPDGADATDLFIPAQGAPNGSQVPPQPGGLFHGTRV
eukprot:g16333.t1